MDIPPLLQKALRNIQQGQAEKTESIAELRDLKIGQKVLALVNKITPLTQDQRQQFSQQFKPAPTTASTNESLSKLLSQVKLHLVELKVHNQTLPVITAEKLVPQQSVLIERRTDGHMQLISKLANTAIKSTLSDQAKATQQTTALNQSKISAQSHFDQNPIKASGIDSQNLTKTNYHQNDQLLTYRDLLSQTLRDVLPKQRPIYNLLKVISNIEQLLQALPQTTQNNLLPPSVRQSLQNLQKFSLPLESTIKTSTIKQAIQNSGIFLEQKLAHAKVINSANKISIQNSDAIKPSSGDTAPRSGRQSLLSTQQDLKAALLDALRIVENIMPTQQGILARGNVTNTMIDQSGATILLLLGQLQKLSIKSSNFLSTRQQMLQQIQQHLSASLARIQMQQFQALNQSLSEGNIGGQNFFVELPVRMGDAFSFLSLHIENRYEDVAEEEQNQQHKQNKKKTSQWEVYLEFELEDKGHLSAQLTVVEDSVTAKFWADTLSIWQATQEGLDKLRAELEHAGVLVKDMQCLTGPPPKKHLKLNYSLVDIET